MSKVKVLHFTSYQEEHCGISTYMENYGENMRAFDGVQNFFFGVSPYTTRPMSYAEMTPVINQLKDELKDNDILHIQHEFGLYWHDQFKRLVEAGKSAGKKVVVTYHLAPDVAIQPVHLGGLSPRNIVKYLRKLRHRRRMVDYHTEPLKQVDAVLVHTQVAVDSLVGFGVDKDIIHILPHPVYRSPSKKTTEITDNLRTSKNDVIFCVSGFLHRYKGVFEAVKALKYLPDNYKLALIGGVKADSDQVNYENKVTDLADAIGVKDRLYITGYVKDHERLKALIGECDLATFPYDAVFYGKQSTGSINLAFSTGRPVVAYPTEVIKEVAAAAGGAIVLCETFAYYELARELKRIDLDKQRGLSEAYAKNMSWSKAAKKLVELYEAVAEK